jgi:hypothetical protein
VFHTDKSIVRTIYRSGDQILLETTQFEGLFQLERLEQGKRVVFRPKIDLARLLPVKPGQKIRAEFEIKGEDKAAIIALSVTERDALYIGACKYNVLKIERSESRRGAPLQFIDTDYYAPELKLIIGREYKEDGGRTNLIKFDRIYPIKP